MKIILYGPDTFNSHAKLNYWRQMFIDKRDPQGINVVNISPDQLDINSFRRLVLSSGLFVSKRLIIIEKFFQQNTEESLLNEVIDFIKKEVSPRQDIASIIFWDEDIKETKLNKSQKKIFSLLQKDKNSQFFPLLTAAQAGVWVKKELVQNNKKINPDALSYLIKEAGTDCWRLTNEINKLIVLPEKVINLDLVKEFVLPRPEEKIWSLVDAIGAKNKKLALKLLADQLELGNEIVMVFGMLVRQYRILLLVRDALDKSGFVRGQELAQRLGLHPFVCQKAIHQVKNYSLSELKSIYQQLFEIDLKTKTTPVNPELLLDLLIVK